MNTRILSTLALFAILMSSCAIKKKAYQEIDKVALISMSSSEEVKNNSGLQARLLTDVRDLDTVVEDIGNKIRTQFFELSPKVTSKIMEEDQLLHSEDFQAYIETLDQELTDIEKMSYMGVDFVSPEGYPFIRPQDKKTMKRAFKYLPSDVDAVLVVQSSYNFEEGGTVAVGGISSSGLGKQKVRCTVRFSMINRSGKRVMNYAPTKLSNNKLGSKSKEGTLDKLVNEALSRTMTEANEKFSKKL